MSGIDLFEELDAAVVRAQAPAARAWRQAQGFPRHAALMGLGGGVGRIEPAVDGSFSPVADGEPGGWPAILFPAWVGPAPGFPEEVFDIVAWVPSQGRTYTRLGLADLMGEWALWQCECIPEPPATLRIYPDPVAWAAAGEWDGPCARGGQGIVVLDWGRARSRLAPLVGDVRFIVDDVATGRRVRDLLTPPPPPTPIILVADRQSEGAHEAA
jgi:hypothetical protein